MSDIEVDDFSHLTTVCPNTVLDQLSVVLSKAVEESISSDQWLYRSLCFLQNNDSNLEQSLSTGDLIEYNNPPGFLNGRAIFLCVSQHNRLYEEELFNSLDNAFYVRIISSLHFRIYDLNVSINLFTVDAYSGHRQSPKPFRRIIIGNIKRKQ